MALLIPLLVLGCKKDEDTDTADQIDCDSYTSTPLGQIPVTEWPEGLAEAQQAYTDLDGRWSADACGETISITINTVPDVASIEVIDSPLPAGHLCGCTHDPSNPNDASLSAIAYTTIQLGVEGYPHPGFSEENAGNVPSVPVTLFAGGDMRVRGCIDHLVPPILGLDFTDTLITIRNGDAGVSGNVELVGDGATPESCQLSGWTRLGDN